MYTEPYFQRNHDEHFLKRSSDFKIIFCIKQSIFRKTKNVDISSVFYTICR